MKDWPSFSTEEYEMLDKRVSQLCQAAFASDPSATQLILKAYLQEAVVYGKTGRWVLDETK